FINDAFSLGSFRIKGNQHSGAAYNSVGHVCIDHAEAQLTKFFSFRVTVLKTFKSRSFRPYVVIPVITFAIGIVLRIPAVGAAIVPLWRFDSEVGIKIDERRVKGLAL